jgi:hypothetical protein
MLAPKIAKSGEAPIFGNIKDIPQMLELQHLHISGDIGGDIADLPAFPAIETISLYGYGNDALYGDIANFPYYPNLRHLYLGTDNLYYRTAITGNINDLSVPETFQVVSLGGTGVYGNISSQMLAVSADGALRDGYHLRGLHITLPTIEFAESPISVAVPVSIDDVPLTPGHFSGNGVYSNGEVTWAVPASSSGVLTYKFSSYTSGKSDSYYNDEYDSNYSGTVYQPYTVAAKIVTFQDHDGTVLKTESVNHGCSATAPENPARAGYSFTGWSAAYDNVTSDITVTAQYTKNAPAEQPVEGVDWWRSGIWHDFWWYGDLVINEPLTPQDGVYYFSVAPSAYWWNYLGSGASGVEYSTAPCNLTVAQDNIALHDGTVWGNVYLNGDGVSFITNAMFSHLAFPGSGNIKGNVFLNGNNVSIAGTTIEGNVYLNGGSCSLANVKVYGNIYINGKSAKVKDTMVFNGNVEIRGDGAYIDNSWAYNGKIVTGAELGEGDVTFSNIHNPANSSYDYFALGATQSSPFGATPELPATDAFWGYLPYGELYGGGANSVHIDNSQFQKIDIQKIQAPR